MARRQSPKIAATVNLQPLTASRWDGGLNLSKAELVLDTSSSTVQNNIYNGPSGGMTVRQGTEILADLSPIAAEDLVDATYFYVYIISVGVDGHVYATDSAGVSTTIWSPAIAALSGVPAWGGGVEGVSFVPFNGDLVIHNGVDKPIIISPTLIVTYLQDLATGSNVNVPVGRNAVKHGRWHIVAVGSELHISQVDTSGTFFGDPAPNYALVINLAPRVVDGSEIIVGLHSFREYLVVFFESCLLPIQMAFDDNAATPVVTVDYSDAIEGYGALSQRVVESIGDEMLTVDIVGVATLTRSIFSKVTEGGRTNSEIFSLVQMLLSKLSVDVLRNRVFMVWDRLEFVFRLFIPNDNNNITETIAICYARNKKEGVARWHVERGWNWRWATRTAHGRIIFGRGKKLFLLGQADIDPINADYVGEQEPWSDGTVWSDNTGWSPVAINVGANYQGVDIIFDWQWPWSEMKKGGLIKKTRYISLATRGTALFTVSMFIDNYLTTRGDPGETWSDGTLWSDGTGWNRGENLQYDPALSLEFIGADRDGFGFDYFGSGPYGLGRSTEDVRPFDWPAQFSKMKMRFNGRTREKLIIDVVRLFYQVGSMRR